MPAQPNLIQDPPAGPGVHVLVIGVSAYRHLAGGTDENPAGINSRLGQINGPAKSAARFASWMVNSHHHSTLHTGKLKSLRVLISADHEQEDVDPEIKALIDASGHPGEADSQTVQETIYAFQNDCMNDRESMVVIYICGHGIKMVEDGAKMLCSDYARPGAPLLSSTLDLNSFYKGMQGEIFPQTQLWFYDCCAQPPAEARRFEELHGAAIGLDSYAGAADAAPIFMSAKEGTLALGLPNQESFFCQSVLWLLDHYGAAISTPLEFSEHIDANFVVTTNSLNQHLKFVLSKVADAQDSDQSYRPAGRPNPAVFHEYRDPVMIPTKIAVDPKDFTHDQRSLVNPRSEPIALADENWPIEMDLETGLYLVLVQPPDGVAQVTVPKAVQPSPLLDDIAKPATIEHVVEIKP